MCDLSVDGMGPVASHCPECDQLIHVASLPDRTPGRGFAIAIDPYVLKEYGRSFDDDDIAALSLKPFRVSGSLTCGFFSDHCSWGAAQERIPPPGQDSRLPKYPHFEFHRN
jgi:hypothetical protein